MSNKQPTTIDELLRNFVAAASVLAIVTSLPGHELQMSKMLPSLTDAQQKMVLSALATLRMSSHDKFLLDLASALARSPQPVSDLYLRVHIRQLLGLVPVKDIVHNEADAC